MHEPSENWFDNLVKRVEPSFTRLTSSLMLNGCAIELSLFTTVKSGRRYTRGFA